MMGFYPKHLRVRRHRQAMNLIARAALAGCIYIRQVQQRATGRYNTYGYEIHEETVLWCVHYPDGRISFAMPWKRMCATTYLKWYYTHRIDA